MCCVNLLTEVNRTVDIVGLGFGLGLEFCGIEIWCCLHHWLLDHSWTTVACTASSVYLHSTCVLIGSCNADWSTHGT